jgi:hypothetical protein
MDTGHILKPTVTVSNSLFSKIKRFFAAALLADFVLGNAINVFIENLNKKGLLGLGSDFQTYQMIWGESIWLNILHLIILGLIAGIFGFTFGYLSRRVSLSEKIIFTFLYVFIRLIFIAVFSVIIDYFVPNASNTWNEAIGIAIYVISSSAFYSTFIILSYIVMFASAFYFIDKGSKVINDPYYTTDKSVNGTLFDIKWYHYLWLFIPISFYIQILLNLLYKVGHTIATLISNFRWHTIFGGSEGGKGNALDVAWGSLFFIFIVAMIVIYLMDYLRKVLAGETDQHWCIKLLISLGIGIVIPFLILFFTSLAG